MPTNEENLRKSQQFIAELLRAQFGQTDIDPDELLGAARKLCRAVPGR